MEALFVQQIESTNLQTLKTPLNIRQSSPKCRHKCTRGSLNRAKGKETYPSLVFECVTDYNRRIMGVYGPQFGSRNNKEIVKSDPAVLKVTAGWLSKTFWYYYSTCGRIRSSVGMYLICDNGYLRWPTSIFPYTHVDIASTEGYFLSNLESV